VNRACLAVVEPDLFEWDVFEMAAPIQSPAKCELRSIVRFLNQKVNVQRKFRNKLLLFMVTLWIGKMWRGGAVNYRKGGLMFTANKGVVVRRRWRGARRSHGIVQRSGGRLVWLGDKEGSSKT
jgi:hypothetical protein